MDNESYEQIELPAKQIEEELKFLKENMEVHLFNLKMKFLVLNCQLQLHLKLQKLNRALKAIQQAADLNQLKWKQA